MKKSIKEMVDYYIRKCDSRNPFDIADYLNIQLQIGQLGSKSGCYMFLKNHRCIFLNEDLTEQEKKMVMSHELGHAIMHRKQNCYFIKNKTLLLNSKSEREANVFAAELLIPDEIISEYNSYTMEELSKLLGYDRQFVEIKLKTFCAI